MSMKGVRGREQILHDETLEFSFFRHDVEQLQQCQCLCCTVLVAPYPDPSERPHQYGRHQRAKVVLILYVQMHHTRRVRIVNKSL